MCDKSLIKLIFKAFFQEGVFPDVGKKLMLYHLQITKAKIF